MLKTIISSLASKNVVPLASVLAAALFVTTPARADDQPSIRQLLAAQFKSSTHVGYVRVRLTDGQRERVEQRLGRRLPKTEYTLFVAQTGAHVDGYALFDEERGQHELISFGTFFDAQGHVTRVEVLAYREPFGDEIRAERFRRQFVGRDAHSGFATDHDIDAISGASISSRSMCTGVQRAAVLLEEAVLRERAPLASL
jgi:Na+-translocating ferredoxin:NAD+ oxidoreductase RnfG subunit